MDSNSNFESFCLDVVSDFYLVTVSRFLVMMSRILVMISWFLLMVARFARFLVMGALAVTFSGPFFYLDLIPRW